MNRAIQVDFLLAGLVDGSGDVLAGGRVYTYEAGTSTPKNTYTVQDKTTAETNPIILDARGVKHVFAEGAYKFVVKDSSDVTQYTLDNLQYIYPDDGTIYAGTSTGSSNAYAVTPSPALTTLTDGLTITFIANFASTGAATLNPSGLGVYNFVRADGTTPLTSGDITSGMITDARYILSSNHFRLVSQAGVLSLSGGGTGAATAPAARTNLGLGTMAIQNANAVTITGGTAALTTGSISGTGTIGNVVATTGTITTGTVTTLTSNAATVSTTLTMSGAQSYPATFGYAAVRTVNPAAGTNAYEQTLGNAWNTLVRDLVALGILKP